MRHLLTLAMLLVTADATAQQVGPFFRLRLQSACTTPPTGYVNICSKTSNKHVYSRDALGAEVDLTGGGGGGSGDMLLGTAQAVTAAKTFNAGTLLANNAGNTFASTLASAATAARTFTLPDATDTAVGLAATQTLTNKTITAPVLSGSATGTYTLAGTPTITAPAISSPTFSGTPVLGTLINDMGFSQVRNAAANGVSDGGAGFTVGSKIAFTQPATITGIKAYWLGGVGAVTLKTQVWDSTNASVCTVNLAVNAAGTYSGNCGSPVTVAASVLNKVYTVSAYEANHYTYVATAVGKPGCVLTTGVCLSDTAYPTKGGIVTVVEDASYDAGDTRPTTNLSVSNQFIPIEVIISAN